MRVARPRAGNVRISSLLSKQPMIGREEAWEVVRMVPRDVIPVLKAAGVDFMLVGAHGISGWMSEPRATQDVDFILRKRDVAKVSAALMSRFPNLIEQKNPDVRRYFAGEKPVVDLILTTTPLHKRVFTEFSQMRIDGSTVRVPKVEAALAMKFAAMTGHFRNFMKKHKDASDFIDIATHNEVNIELLNELGELVFVGGGKQAVDYVRAARAGKRMEI